MRTKLKLLRVENNLTQNEMAKKTGVSIATYNKIENGTRNGSMEFWKNVQIAFNLTDAEVWNILQDC